MPTVKLKRIIFDRPPFRKLAGMTIDFADRLTVIAGHNGTGKSTILALVANASGVSRTDHRSLFGKAFQANLFDIVHIDYEGEYAVPKAAGRPLPEPTIEYLLNGSIAVFKKCSLTARKNPQKARVVPRNSPLADIRDANGAIAVRRDAKVKLPTIYLGMIRMFPVGEANPSWVKPAPDASIPAEECGFISAFVNSVIPGSNARSTSITSMGIRGTGKLVKHPQYTHDPRCVSLGQDALGSIATALASFQHLKRTWSEYPGGLLVIDEVDSGLHPAAQTKLIKALRSAARDLSLQIICTTHSPHLIQAVHPGGQGSHRSPDAVVYLTDTGSPRVATRFTLADIIGDMSLAPPGPAVAPTARKLKVYFEDDEAAFMFKKLVPASLTRHLNKKYRVRLSILPLGVGCTNLVGLSAHDPYFRSVVIVVDADSPTGRVRSTQHVVRLPGKDASGRGMSPERTLYLYISELLADRDAHATAWNSLENLRVSSDQLREHLLDDGRSVANREAAKKWWNDKRHHIQNWKLIEMWAADHAEDVKAFCGALEEAVKIVAKRLG